MVCPSFSNWLHAVLLIVLAVDTKVTKIYNVMAAIPGHITDEVVMVGNHRDGNNKQSLLNT
jgi:N-acetylated-alpha-linked acidic dipeptidase